MTCRNSKLFSILLFAAGIFFLNAPPLQAQACAQAVYLLRHAEDQDSPKQLTPAGMVHAAFYPIMIGDLEDTAGLCKVQRVLAMWSRTRPNGTVEGTANPYFTALPLAESVKPPPPPFQLCPVDSKQPTEYVPEMCFKGDDDDHHTYYLCESDDDDLCKQTNPPYDRNALKKDNGALNSFLYSHLMKYLQGNPQSSVAIFYTQQGMPDISDALNVPHIDVGDPARNWPGTLRSSVNIFTLSGDKSKFVNTLYWKKTWQARTDVKPTQCFAYDRRLEYACQTSAFLTNSPIAGVFCNAVIGQRSSDFYGRCEGPRPPASPHDLDANMISDIVWRDTSGNIAVWLMNGTGVASSGGLGNVPTTWSIVGQRDFNGDGNADLLWHDTSGNVAIWEMNGTTILNSSGTFVANVPTTWSIVGLGDFNADGMGDLLWQDASGNVAIWEMNGTAVLNQNSSFVATVPGQWSIKGVGDFNGDGMTDILWQDSSGNVAIWEMNGTAILNPSSSFVANVPSQWSIRGTGDFNGDGSSDILWQDTSGNVAIWEMNGTTISNSNSSFVGTVPGPWSIAETGDFDGDGKSDLLWRDASGNTAMWLMNGTAVASTVSLANVPTNWTVQAVNAE
jgi:hypothetical protein